MKILDRYIAKHLVEITLMALFVLVTLFSFFSLVDQLEDTGRGNYGVWQAIQYVLLTTPRLACELLPIAAVVGSMATLGTMTKNSELLVVRTAGVSLLQFAWYMCKGGALIILLAIFLGEIISPYAEQKAQHMRSIGIDTTNCNANKIRILVKT